MVKNFDALKSALQRANTPATAQSVRDLTSAIDRLHESYANVYNGYSRTYVMMQELGTKEDGTVHDYTDDARVSIANTALEDKKRQVRDNRAVVEGLRQFLNNNPLKSISLIIDAIAKQPAVVKIASKEAINDPASLYDVFFHSVFSDNMVEAKLAATPDEQSNWEKGLSGALTKGHIRLGSEITRAPVAPLPYGDDLINNGKHCGILVPYCVATGRVSSSKQEKQAGLLWVEAALYTDAADLTKNYVLVDVIKIARPIIKLASYTNMDDLLNDEVTYESRILYHSGDITSITSRRNCQMYWEITAEGLHLMLKDQSGAQIPTLHLTNDIFTANLTDGIAAEVVRDTDSIFADQSGYRYQTGSTVDSLQSTRNAIRADCNKYNYPIQGSTWLPENLELSRLVCSLLGVFMEERLTCDTYPLPIKKGIWEADGSFFTEPLSANMFGSYLTGGYWFFNPQAWARFPSGTLPAYCDLLPMFARSELADVFSTAYALFVGTTRYGDILRESYEQSTVTDSQRRSVTSNVSVGDVVSNSLDYSNEEEILSAIESL